MLNELIEHIEVWQAEKIDGKWYRRSPYVINCVGVIFIPDIMPMPVPDMSVNTRNRIIVSNVPNKRVT